ncbi:MAG: hypothetical protein ACLRWF_02315 [Ruthenibacterium sp.]
MGFAKGKRDWRRTALAMALALACFFATWAVFGLRYELNDDAQLANIAMGAYGEDTHHLVYVNVMLGWFLKPFYALAANVNWYYFLQVAANVAAFGMLGTLCMERLGTRRGLLLYGGVLLAFGVDMFNSFQYTKNSALYLTVGLALLASELGVWSLRTGAGLFWAVLGSMVRFQNFFAVGGLAAALLLWRFLCLEKRARLRALAAAVALFALVGAAKAVDLAAYSTGGWRSFTEYNAARTEFSDFKIYSYTDKTQIEALGYTANDFDMLKSWSFYAPEVFTPQALDALSENAQAGFCANGKSTVYTLAPAGRQAVPAGVWRGAAGVAVFCRQKGQAGLSGHHGRVWRRGVLPAVSGTVCAACGIFHDTGGGGVWRNVHIAARRGCAGPPGAGVCRGGRVCGLPAVFYAAAHRHAAVPHRPGGPSGIV